MKRWRGVGAKISRTLGLLAVASAALAQTAADLRPLRITGITPSGSNVPEGRQIVVQFNRPVVPIGRMDRTAAEIPIAITPALDCQWHWLDTSALACQLGDDDAFALATRYTVVVSPGIRAEDGATLDAARTHEFITERPRVSFVGFARWTSPGTPVLRAVFGQPVSRSSVAAHLFFRHAGARRVPLDVTGDEEERELPRYVRLPGERVFVDFGEQPGARPDDRRTAVGAEEARRVWLLTPQSELPLDADVTLEVEPGLEPAEGNELGDETRTAVAFATFPEFRFNGIVCSALDGRRVVIGASSGGTAPACNPLASVGLQFSTPVAPSEIRNHVVLDPDLAGGRTDYDPWANSQDYSQLGQPHRRGASYTVWLPERLKAFQRYAVKSVAADAADSPVRARLASARSRGEPTDELEAALADAELSDEFGRALRAPLDLAFMTSHRAPDYTLVHPTGVLEQGVDSDIPLYVTNLSSYTLRYRTLTAAGAEPGLVRTVPLPPIEDVQYGVPLGVRELLGGRSGVVSGLLETQPVPGGLQRPQPFLAEVTPYQVHAKVGHFNTLVWVTELATGLPLRGAAVSIFHGSLESVSDPAAARAAAKTDASGIAMLPGSSELDPQLAALQRYCAEDGETCKRLFVRVDGKDGIALIPLDYTFEVNTYRASNYRVFSQSLPKLGHVHAWGTTAQGVYRAGDTMEYKVYVRDQDNESLARAPQGPYELAIVDPTGQTVHTEAGVMLSEFGAYSGTWKIPTSGAVGWYQFQLTSAFDAPPAGAAGAQASRLYEPDERAIVRYPMRVLVSDFTPSPFGVRASLNGDLFEAGDDVVVETRATLFSGGPYVDAEARVTAQIVPRYFSSENPLAAGFGFASGDMPAALPVSQTVGRVGADGSLAQQFRLPDDLGAQIVAGTLSVEGAVRDDRGKYVAGAASADFVAVDRLVGLKNTKWVHRQGEPAVVQYLVVDGRGDPAAGTDVHVEVERLETKAARVKGAGTAYLTQYSDEWVAAGRCDGRSTLVPLDCAFTPAQAGSYRLTATIADTHGRPHVTSTSTWVVGKGRVVWRDDNDDGLEIVPEKAAYDIGDTARYLVKNPYPGARALITIERYGTLKQWVQRLDGSTPVIQFPVEKDFMPGFYLSVLVMSPRVAAPPPEAGELDLGKPGFKLGYVQVPVKDPYKEIDVRVKTERAVYKPRETVRVSVSAQPRQREQREPIEVAVAVLDESVLDLIQGGTSYFDPYEGFYTLDGLDVRNYSLLTRLVGRQKIELKGANPGGDGGSALSMRSLFKYVSYWNPAVVLDSRGNGSFEFEVPDNLTGWRVLVLATTPTDRLGLGQGAFKVNLPTEVRPVMPNQVTEGDRFEAGFSVMNRTDRPRDVAVSISATAGVVEPVAHAETVHLEPYARTTVLAPVRAAPVPLARDVPAGRIDFSVTARDATDGDGLTHSLVVGKRRTLETTANYGSFDGPSVTEPLKFPERIHPDVGDVGAVLSPSVIGNLDGAFRYLRDYPYDCWEQRLTKGVMASHYTRLREYLPRDLEWPEAAGLPQRTLADAANFQAPSGGMAYYNALDMYVSPYLSAYTALAFGWLREDGYDIPEAVESKLLDYLDDFLKRDVAPDFYSRGMGSTVRAVALAALAKRGRLGVADLGRYREHIEYMSLFGKAHYLQAALAVPGAEAIARDVERLLLAASVRSGGKISFNEVLDDGYLRISATPLNSSCAILSSLAKGAMSGGEIGETNDDGTPADVPFELVRAITQARGSRDHWENTQENMFCMNALLDYAQRYESVTPSMTATVSVGGAGLGAAAFTSVRDEPVTVSRPVGPADPGASSVLTIAREGAGRLYYSARMSYASLDDAANEVNAGMEVHKETSVQRDGEWLLLESPMRIRRGELVRVDVYLSLPTARNFVVLDDPVPGGLEPVNRDLANASLVDADAGAFKAAGGAWWFRFSDWLEYGVSRWSFYHQEIRHDAVRFYSDYLPPGNYHLSYTAQAIAEGEFASPPAKAVEMYDPDVYGLSLPGTLVVEAAP
jgi:uncharacterized protein YfaS (alpha-2-macroglobulin family)